MRRLGLVREEEAEKEEEAAAEAVAPAEEDERIREARRRILEAIEKLSTPRVRRMIELGMDVEKIEEELLK